MEDSQNFLNFPIEVLKFVFKVSVLNPTLHSGIRSYRGGGGGGVDIKQRKNENKSHNCIQFLKMCRVLQALICSARSQPIGYDGFYALNSLT